MGVGVAAIWAAASGMLDDAVHVSRDWIETPMRGILTSQRGSYYERADVAEYPEFRVFRPIDCDVMTGDLLRVGGVEWQVTSIVNDDSTGEMVMVLRKHADLDRQ